MVIIGNSEIILIINVIIILGIAFYILYKLMKKAGCFS